MGNNTMLKEKEEEDEGHTKGTGTVLMVVAGALFA
jgi:hypothetical protein